MPCINWRVRSADTGSNGRADKTPKACIRHYLGGFALPLAGCARSGTPHKFTGEYQAVFMDNGQVFFGRLDTPWL